MALPFKHIAVTIREHTEGIIAYVTSGLSNGRTEGHMKTKSRRVGLRSSVEALVVRYKNDDD